MSFCRSTRLICPWVVDSTSASCTWVIPAARRGSTRSIIFPYALDLIRTQADLKGKNGDVGDNPWGTVDLADRFRCTPARLPDTFLRSHVHQGCLGSLRKRRY